uniref:CDP-glycerol glycerophosphotransferase family protein n=1 Tax=Lachnospira sp. TaxID=2049031 RepID=UPI003FEEC019
VFSFSFKNIKIVRNSDLEDLNIQLYQMVKYTDVLITDYSSISTDYMLLNQPIIYILDDYEEYKSARGLSPENAIDLLVGYHVVNVSELKTAIIEVGDGIDKFKEKRNVILPDLHKHIDGNACERIIEKLSL